MMKTTPGRHHRCKNIIIIIIISGQGNDSFEKHIILIKSKQREKNTDACACKINTHKKKQHPVR